MEKRRLSRRWRIATLLAVGALIGVLMSASPAGAHFKASIDHIWSHIKPKADARYLQNTKTFVKAGGSVAAGSFDSESVMCPDGWQAIGGGVDINQIAGGHVASSEPLVGGARTLTLSDGQHSAANGWFGAVNNDPASPSSAPYWVIVVCAK